MCRLKAFPDYEETAKARNAAIPPRKIDPSTSGQHWIIDGGVNLRRLQFDVNLFLLEILLAILESVEGEVSNQAGVRASTDPSDSNYGLAGEDSLDARRVSLLLRCSCRLIVASRSG